MINKIIIKYFKMKKIAIKILKTVFIISKRWKNKPKVQKKPIKIFIIRQLYINLL